MTTSRMCPTCRSRQDFRKLNDAEKAAVRKEKGPHHFVNDLWRCTAKGCLWYQPYFRQGDGGILPEGFREEQPAGQ